TTHLSTLSLHDALPISTLNRNAQAEFLAGHIPGAAFFDIDAIADHSTDLPHMLPGATMFSKEVSALGIGKDDTIVVYDGAGLGRSEEHTSELQSRGHLV